MAQIRTFIVSSLAIALLSFAVARWVIDSSFRAASHSVCSLVAEHYYRSLEPRVTAWVERCHATADRQSFVWRTADEVDRINRRLSFLRISHLTLYSPTENRQIWDNESLDTGIRARMIDGAVVVYRVLAASPALQAGVRAGDVVRSINRREVSSESMAQSSSGEYLIDRQGKQIKIHLEPIELVENLAPALEPLPQRQVQNQSQNPSQKRVGAAAALRAASRPEIGLLRIPSFLAQYFDQEAWREVTKHFGDYKSLIIDVRGNAGGSFPAMLRALSPFRCAQPQVGQLFHVNVRHVSSVLTDDLDASLQLEKLSQSDVVQLRAFTGYGCFDGPVTVLMDGDTSSVAEIFAQAFFLRPKARVWGEPSAGQVVMAQWFPIDALGGDDYSLSIPIAGYRSVDGMELESQGLEPARILRYDLDRAKQGRDSWLEEAARPTPTDLRRVSN